MNKVIVHVRRNIPGVGDFFAFQREFNNRQAAEAYIAYNDGYDDAPAPRAGLYGIIIN